MDAALAIKSSGRGRFQRAIPDKLGGPKGRMGPVRRCLSATGLSDISKAVAARG
jgi:hypothetical protein